MHKPHPEWRTEEKKIEKITGKRALQKRKKKKEEEKKITEKMRIKEVGQMIKSRRKWKEKKVMIGEGKRINVSQQDWIKGCRWEQ